MTVLASELSPFYARVPASNKAGRKKDNKENKNLRRKEAYDDVTQQGRMCTMGEMELPNVFRVTANLPLVFLLLFL